MNKRTLVLIVAAGLVALVGVAFVADSARIARQLYARVELADQDLSKPEERLMTLLEDSPTATPEVKAAIDAYRSAASIEDRHDRYQPVVSAFRLTMQGSIDPTDPLARKFMDDVAGAMNRREVALTPYVEEWKAYRAYMEGDVRGRAAGWFLGR